MLFCICSDSGMTGADVRVGSVDMDENDMNNEIVNGKRYESVLFDYYNTKVLKGVLMKIHF